LSAPPFLSIVPPPAPPTPAQEERATREEMLRALGWRVEVSAPPWREVLFLGSPRLVVLPPIPDGVVARIKGLKQEWFSPDEIGIKALTLAEGLQKSMPLGAVPRSIGAARELPPPLDAVQGWTRTAIVTACGPDVAPLLVSGGFLTVPDVEFFDTTYPEGTKEQRLAMTEASSTVSSAARRAGEATAFPQWLDEQTITFMGEARDVAQLNSLHEPDQSSDQGGGAGGGPNPSGGASTGGDSKIANQFRPNPGPESAQ
jgi:hypothetical protein